MAKNKVMRSIVIIIIILVFGLGRASTQAEKDFVYYNQKTYELYLSGQWPELIEEGKEAIRAGYDFYYLRQRLGIAYYELKQYGRAVPHFYAALGFNQENAITKEYLYYSLLFSGRSGEAGIFADAVGLSPPASIFALGSYKWSDQETIVDALEVYSAGLSHAISKQFRLTHAFEYVNQHFLEYLEEEISNGNGPGRTVLVENPYNYDQSIYRLRGDLELGKAWQTGFTFQNIWGENEGYEFNQQAYWLYLGKSFSIFRLELEGGYANFAEQDIFQAGLNTVIYPLANTRLYYLIGLNIKNAEGKTQQWLNQKLGLRLAPGLWAEGLVDFGEISYYQEAKGAIAYNIADPIRSRIGANLQYWPSNKWMIFLQFQQEQKTHLNTLEDFRHQGLMLGLNFQW